MSENSFLKWEWLYQNLRNIKCFWFRKCNRRLYTRPQQQEQPTVLQTRESSPSQVFDKFWFGEQALKWRTVIPEFRKQVSYREFLEEFKEGRLLEIITSNLRWSQKNKTGTYRTKSIQLLSTCWVVPFASSSSSNDKLFTIAYFPNLITKHWLLQI